MRRLTSNRKNSGKPKKRQTLYKARRLNRPNGKLFKPVEKYPIWFPNINRMQECVVHPITCDHEDQEWRDLNPSEDKIPDQVTTRHASEILEAGQC